MRRRMARPAVETAAGYRTHPGARAICPRLSPQDHAESIAYADRAKLEAVLAGPASVAPSQPAQQHLAEKESVVRIRDFAKTTAQSSIPFEGIGLPSPRIWGVATIERHEDTLPPPIMPS